jgi:hypothetical protein
VRYVRDSIVINTKRGFVREMGMKYGDYSLGIRAAPGIDCFISRLPCSGDAQAALFFLLLGALTCFDLLRGTEFPRE